RLDLGEHGLRACPPQDHPLEGLAGDLVEGRLDDGIGDDAAALLDELPPTLLVGRLRRLEIGVAIGALARDYLAAAGGDRLRLGAAHELHELPGGVLARRVRVYRELEAVDRVL